MHSRGRSYGVDLLPDGVIADGGFGRGSAKALNYLSRRMINEVRSPSRDVAEGKGPSRDVAEGKGRIICTSVHCSACGVACQHLADELNCFVYQSMTFTDFAKYMLVEKTSFRNEADLQDLIKCMHPEEDRRTRKQRVRLDQVHRVLKTFGTDISEEEAFLTRLHDKEEEAHRDGVAWISVSQLEEAIRSQKSFL